MNKHRTPEQQEAGQRAGKWNAVARACWLASALLLFGQSALSKYLSRLVGCDAGSMLGALALLLFLWIGVAACCQARAYELSLVAQGKKAGREHKQEPEARAARAEKLLGSENR